jgi:conjugal transfer pilus assembly protein TraK
MRSSESAGTAAAQRLALPRVTGRRAQNAPRIPAAAMRTTCWHLLPPSARRILVVTALAYGLPAQALQVVEASDGVAAEAIVSLKEPTRLRIDGAGITDVFGNIHSSHCGPGATGPAPAMPATAPGGAHASSLGGPVNAAGDVIVACDRDKGEVYLRPVGNGTRPINLFVSSATATYTLLLRRADTPADTIVIRDKTPRALRPQAHEQAPAGPAPNHVRTMKALLVAMVSDRVPSDVRVEETQRPLQLWAETRFTLMRLYEGRGFVGEKYALQNIGATPMVLAEQEFDRAAGRAGGEVAGIAIEHHNLRPGESTSVYVLRRGGTR